MYFLKYELKSEVRIRMWQLLDSMMFHALLRWAVAFSNIPIAWSFLGTSGGG
jgi:hypothetical protein